ncbi:MAG: hypothetical protein KC423_21135 [Anaerolineales bacterium]|nr:hypothetical protein [Anaerolineales bacterium]
MFTEDVSPTFAAQIENEEVTAWQDMYDALPADFANQFQLKMMRVQNVALTLCPAIPFIHFNAVKNFGMGEPTSEALLDDICTIYREAGIRHFTFYHMPHCQPPELSGWLKSRGFQAQGGWDRIYRDNQPLTAGNLVEPANGLWVEKVTLATASEWSGYIDAMYGLPTSPWLLATVERPGWHHYMLRQGGQIVAVRSMFLNAAGWAWFGIEAPVPGIMAPSFDLDRQLCQAMVQDGLKLGAQHFVADIEAPTPAMDTPAYHHFAELGFKRPYFRTHYNC